MNDIITSYCDRYFIPKDYLLEILEDSKVVPMIRGKATEYNAYIFLKNHLDPKKFDVQKLNLNAQSNHTDEDVSITHRRTGVRLMIEVKNACRGSFSDGSRAKIFRNSPHFKVKCHKSRSNIKKAGTTNDRYIVGDFDLLVSNPLNSIYEGSTYTDELQLIDEKLINILMRHYGVSSEKELENACNNDWRFAFPEDIAENIGGELVVPRTPYVKLDNDSNWFNINKLSEKLEAKAIEKRKK